LAKRDRKIRRQHQDFEISESIDDYLLPSAEEIEKYKEVDSELLAFIKKTAEKEQQFRHNYNNLGIKLSFREQLLQHGLNYLGLFFGFCIAILGIWFSRELLLREMKLEGTLFGGAVLTYLAYLFINIVSKRIKPQKE